MILTFRVDQSGVDGSLAIPTSVDGPWDTLLPVAGDDHVVVIEQPDRSHGGHLQEAMVHVVGHIQMTIHGTDRHVGLVGGSDSTVKGR